MKTKDLISIAISSIKLISLIICALTFLSCGVEAARQSSKQKQSATCGTLQVIPGDARTISPWTAAIFTRSTSGKSPARFFTNGVIIGPTLVLGVVGGPYGVTLRNAKNPKYSIPSADIYHVYAGINTTDFEAHDEFTQSSRVLFVEPFRGHDYNNEHYHFFLYHLSTPLNFSTAYVKEICLPIILKNVRNQNPFGWQLIQAGFAQGPGSVPLALKTWKVTTGPKKSCESTFRYNYKRELGTRQSDFCGRRDNSTVKNTAPYATIVNSVDRGDVDNDLCQLHGSSLTFEIGVWYLASLVTLIPGRRRGRCSHKSFYMYGDVIGGLDWLAKSYTCSPNKFACGVNDDSSCIPFSSVCNGISDECKDGSDEDEIFCGAQNNCPMTKNKDQPPPQHSCGLSGGCIAKDLVCDGKSDCDNGSDEHPAVCQRQGNSSIATVTKMTVKNTSSRRRSCPLIKAFESTVINCFETTNETVDCEGATFVGAKVTLECDKYHRTHFSYDSVAMTCGPDGEWQGRKPFSCDQECGVIREGQIDNYSGLPWHAIIFSTVNQKNFQTCSAVLIEKKFLLTAAQCVSTWLTKKMTTDGRDLIKVLINPSSSKININLQNQFVQVSPVKQIWISPPNPKKTDSSSISSSMTSNLVGAIAMIELQNTAEIDAKNRPTPACYAVPPFRVPSPGKIGLVTGFGIGDGSFGEQLKIANVTVANSSDGEECKGFDFCTDSNEGAPLCNADVGGGVFFLEKTGDRMAYVLKGISNPTNPQNCSETKYSKFTSIDIYADWILDILETFS